MPGREWSRAKWEDVEEREEVVAVTKEEVNIIITECNTFGTSNKYE